MVKLQIGVSTFFCDTAEEAVRIHRLVGNGVAATQGTAAVTAHRSHSKSGQQSLLFLRKLTPYVGKDLSSDDMAKVAGAASATGLGPKMAQIKKRLANEGVILDDFIVRKKPDAAGPVTWSVVKAEA